MENIYTKFISKLEEKVPQKKVLVEYIASTLDIERDSAYRRLRGDVLFSFQEASILAKSLNISLDNLNATNGNFKNRPFYFSAVNYIHPEEVDYQMLQVFLDALNQITNDPESELGANSKIIPDVFKANSPYINRFYLLKQMIQYGEGDNYPNFKEVVMPDKMKQLVFDLMTSYRVIKSSSFVLDKYMFRNIVNDITYFSELHLIDKDDIQALKNELLDILDYIEGIAAKGVNELGNKMSFYISDIDFDNDFFYISSSKFSFNLFRAFTLNDIISTDSSSMQTFRRCVQALKRTSVQISESGEITRRRLFNEQREHVNRL